jgi:hypothetical protein
MNLNFLIYEENNFYFLFYQCINDIAFPRCSLIVVTAAANLPPESTTPVINTESRTPNLYT